ncbi:MAG: hypothetical protein KF819_10500 [Labilithrix sp.]|nr:hypothetical protein [Labilithrix sp.]
MIHGLFGRPFVDLERFIDLSALEEIHEEICLGLSQVPVDYTGGSHRAMCIMPASRTGEAHADYGEIIPRLGAAEYATFRSLADEPASFPASPDGATVGEERDHPLSRRQMLWLEYRFGVYFPWKIHLEMIPNRYWDEKSSAEGKDFTRVAKTFFPKTVAFARSLPFEHVGRCNVMGLSGNDHGSVHRDGAPEEKPDADHFVTICPAGNKRLYLWDEEKKEKLPVSSRAYWFNDSDYHGVDADPFFRDSIRVDGVCHPEHPRRRRRHRRVRRDAHHVRQGRRQPLRAGLHRSATAIARHAEGVRLGLRRRRRAARLRRRLHEALRARRAPVARRRSRSGARRSPPLLPARALRVAERGAHEPRVARSSEAVGFQLLSTVVQPIATPAMAIHFERGTALASLFLSLVEGGGKPTDAKTAIIVDLPGPDAVAFAAGAASIFDPVFLFDNWPHPRGVVRAHETLSAAAYYQPLFAKARATRGPAADRAPPMFVLDRRRLFAYTDDATQFDNRYVAKLPSPSVAMRALGVNNVLYVVPLKVDTAVEMDDVNDDLLLYKGSGMDVRSLSTDMFQHDATASASVLYYGGSPLSHHAFFADYPWAKPARAASLRPHNPGTSFTPRPRSTAYSTGTPTGSVARARPADFGTVPVAVAVASGVVLGARHSRSGSWNRTSGGSSSS